MASGHVDRTRRRTHRCTDQACDVKILLANLEPSTHGPKRRFASRERTSESGVKPTCRHRSIDAIDPEPTWAGQFCCDAKHGSFP